MERIKGNKEVQSIQSQAKGRDIKRLQSQTLGKVSKEVSKIVRRTTPRRAKDRGKDCYCRGPPASTLTLGREPDPKGAS